jgi:purine-binding chemotaxis protein CheW
MSTAENPSLCQYITFAVEGDEYGVDINAVREIKAWTPTTELPNADPFMRGVINLRGAIVPIYDLRTLFGKGSTEASGTHVVVILAVEQRISGILVDAVSDIISLDAGQIQPPPNSDAGSFISGLAEAGERMVMLLDAQKLLKQSRAEAA